MMIKKEVLNDLPHSDLIRENETIELRSIFDFKGGNEELFPFLYGCRQANCTVVFKNEDVTVYPEENKNDRTQDVLLSIYAMIAQDPKVANDYIKYLCFGLRNNGKMD